MAFPLRASPFVVNSTPMGVILAIDYGQKRLGLALSDEHGVTSRPFAIWTRINRRRDLARLRELVRQHAVRQIVGVNKSTVSSHRARKQHAGHKRRPSCDDVAAAVILRDYLARARPQAGARD